MKKSYHAQINQDNLESKSYSNFAVILHKQRGFSLVEIMVASTISIIILLAASSTFLTTYKLKEQVKTRINYEQDVRNAANLLRSDTRQLGNFSCMNPPTTNNLNNIFNGSFTDPNNKQFLSTRFTKDGIGITQTRGSQPLIMTYINENYANTLVSTKCNNSIPDLEHHVDAAVYMVGTTNSDTVPSLYRVNYSGGRWSAPQLLVSNVSNIQYSFDYDGHSDDGHASTKCPQPSAGANSSVQVIDNVKKDQLDFNFAKPPVLIKVTLTINQPQANAGNVNYVINAMVRQGEVCINNQVQQ
ncbi:PilW family protein [Snodgrassella alvi]|uniref:Prepilin-type N-terminal cleavage/methylation domain-containing protein n=1 Tax=Snodgrassella alvi TaxID=1196083 RepID=A0A2N9WUN3_9NEIS|nr:prepilin-type N-terminal cleavage/methylation domain-containing protein [Snodgrassella alvi]PIT16413.1 hypothetical protein BGI32_04550 [Snodgrassella alvi]PIT18566.1 hypothetical protein BGI33_01170 [Snodgrassella alvi]PIT19291.1 hypothetical protein BGI34_02530 [Snodgrassella alvi]